jgi:hypothetical protein
MMSLPLSCGHAVKHDETNTGARHETYNVESVTWDNRATGAPSARAKAGNSTRV